MRLSPNCMRSVSLGIRACNARLESQRNLVSRNCWQKLQCYQHGIEIISSFPAPLAGVLRHQALRIVIPKSLHFMRRARRWPKMSFWLMQPNGTLACYQPGRPDAFVNGRVVPVHNSHRPNGASKSRTDTPIQSERQEREEAFATPPGLSPIARFEFPPPVGSMGNDVSDFSENWADVPD
jgi:hypothetical protein